MILTSIRRRPARSFLLLVLLLTGTYWVSVYWYGPGVVAARELPPDVYRARAGSIDLAELATNAIGCGGSGGIGGDEACVVLVYIWSASMPLSVLGLENARAAAGQSGCAIVSVEAETLAAEYNSNKPGLLAQQLIAAGALIHYPTIALLTDGEVVGSVVAGYKSVAGYARIFESRLTDLANGVDELVGSKNSPDGHITVPGDKVGQLVTKVIAEVPGWVGAFVQPVDGGNWIAYERNRSNYAVSRISGDIQRLPGTFDPVPSPDGRLLFAPLGDRKGLEIYQLQQAGQNIDARSLLKDTAMNDQYPSVGLIGQGARFTAYRVLTSWFKGGRYRDYKAEYSSDGILRGIKTITPVLTACPEFDLSLPILSPDGQELAARDENTGSSKLFRLRPDGGCEEILDLRLQAGKLAFSPSGRKIALAIPRGTYQHGAGKIDFAADAGTSGGGAFVLDRDTMVMTKFMDGSQLNNLTFPKFISEHEVLVMRYTEGDSPVSQFVSVCCLD